MSARMGLLGSKHMTFYDLASEFTQNYFSHLLLVKAITSWSDFRRKTHGVHPLMWGLSKYLQPYLKTATGIFSFREWPKLLPAVESGLEHSLVMLHMHFFSHPLCHFNLFVRWDERVCIVCHSSSNVLSYKTINKVWYKKNSKIVCRNKKKT